MKSKTNKKIRTGVRAGKGEAEVMNNPLYCGNEASGHNPLHQL